MSLFGKDIESNIFALIAFADGGAPDVLASLTVSKLPFGKKIKLNNSALFAENKLDEIFFGHIILLHTKSVSQTKYVLDERSNWKLLFQIFYHKSQQDYPNYQS